MKKATNCLLLVAALSLVLATISCQSATPPQTENMKPAFELQIDMPGASHALLLNSEGRLLARADLASDDGTVILSVDKNTGFLDKDGRPLSSIWVKPEPELLPLAEGARIIGTVYSLGPQDATFNAPLKLTLSYDPQEIPEDVREDDVYIVPYDKSTGWGSYSYKRVETDKHQVTTQIERFTRYAVLAPVRPSSPQPIKEVTPVSDLTLIPLHEALSSGKPTLAEFGASTCVPCKQMKPILEQLAIDYEGKLNIVIIEVYEQMELARQHGIMAIPTQIVFGSSGQEVTRHMGLWPREEIIAQLEEMGID